MEPFDAVPDCQPVRAGELQLLVLPRMPFSQRGADGGEVSREHDHAHDGELGDDDQRGRVNAGDSVHPVLLGRYDAHGRLVFLTQTVALRAGQRRDVAALLVSMVFQGRDAEHPWPCPLPARWTTSLTDPRPLRYLPIEPTVVAEINVDIARTAGPAKTGLPLPGGSGY
jgi:hypothetical protein